MHVIVEGVDRVVFLGASKFRAVDNDELYSGGGIQ